MMRRLAWIAIALFGLVGPTLPMASGQGTGVMYQLIFNCPGQGPVGTQSCPVRAVDSADAMGDPSLAVDPFEPNNLIMGSLHGVGDNQGAPSVKSRSAQVFTTFTSTDSGATWYDSPFFPPDEVGGDTGVAYGEHSQVVIDPYGHVYVGSLYSQPTGEGLNFTYVIAAQKFSSLRNIQENQGRSGTGDYHAQYLDPVYPDNEIAQMWFLFNPRTDNMTMVWNEQIRGTRPPPCLPDTVLVTLPGYYVQGKGLPPIPSIWQETNGIDGLQTPSTCPENPDTAVLAPLATQIAARPDVVAALAKAAAAPAVPATPPASLPRPVVPMRTSRSSLEENVTLPPTDLETPRGVIGIVWTTPSTNSTYYYQDLEHAIGPCSSSTNPVLKDGYLYVGCVADPARGLFRWHPETTPGTLELFRIDLDNGTTSHVNGEIVYYLAPPEYMGAAPVIGGVPKLGVRSDGRMALVSSGALDGRLTLSVAFGRYDGKLHQITWTDLGAYGSILERVNPELKIVDAGVQDLIYREFSGVVHIILKEIIQRIGLNAAALADPLAPHIRKYIVAIDETYGVLAKRRIDIGNLANRTSDSTLMEASEMVYNDLSDDFLQLPAGPYSFNGVKFGDFYQREFFAIADYGQVMFAEVVEQTTLRGPAFAMPPAPVPPIPAPALAPASTLVTAVGLSVSTMMAAAFVAQRQRHLTAIKAKLKKKQRNL